MQTNLSSLPGAGRVQDVTGMRQLWKLQADQTGGALVCVEIAVPPGAGIPLHRHTHEDEIFYVTDGDVIFEGDDCEGGSVALGPGGMFYGPRGRFHAFRCAGAKTARLLVIVTPGTALELAFGDMSALAGIQGRDVDGAQVASICEKYGITFATDRPSEEKPQAGLAGRDPDGRASAAISPDLFDDVIPGA